MTRSFAFLALFALLLAGCGSGGVNHPKTAPVSGSITYKNKTYTGIRATFHPQFETDGKKWTPVGETDKDGKFTLNAGAQSNGAPPGEYVVTFDWPRVETDRKNSGIETEVDLFKGRYSDPARSQWKVTIKDGENVLDPFRLD